MGFVQEDYFAYLPPIHYELKELGYNLPFQPTEEDIKVVESLLYSSASELDSFLYLLPKHNLKDCAVGAIRIYAYYINNPQQFNHDPNNIVGSMTRSILSTALSFLTNIHKVKFETYIPAKKLLIGKFKQRLLDSLLNSSLALAKRVKYNTLLDRELKNQDLNIDNKINIKLFR